MTFVYPLKRAISGTIYYRNLASKRLQIGTFLLLIITSTVDKLSKSTNIDDFGRP